MMTSRKQAKSSKAAVLIENHSTLATLLAVLCLAFAVNYFFAGPGSDGGSGLGGTGKFGGESGLGGTGKTPDSGPSFKLGANDSDDEEQSVNDDELTPGYRELSSLLADMDNTRTSLDRPDEIGFDVSSLRLSLNQPPVAPVDRLPADVDKAEVASLVSAIVLDSESSDIAEMLQEEKSAISTNALVSSLEILNGLMVAEAETNLGLATTESNERVDANARSRVNMPVRPERPDRLNIPTRVNAVQRTAIPAPPPVRPMRTLSSLLNH